MPTSTGGGDGSTKPTVGQLFLIAKMSALSLQSAHMVGEKNMGGALTKLDLAGDAFGTNQKLIVTEPSLGTIELLAVGGKNYLKSDAKFWESQAPGMGAKLAGKYVAVPDSKTGGMSQVKLNTLIQQAFSDSGTQGLESSTAAPGETNVKGVPGYVLTKGPGELELVVSTDGKANLLMVKGSTKEPGTIYFSEHDSVPKFTAPPASEVVTAN